MEEVHEIVSETIAQDRLTFITWVKTFLTWENLFRAIFAVIMIFFFWILYKLAVRGIKKLPSGKTNAPKNIFFRRLAKYCFYIFSIMYVLSLFGVRFSAVWGAAGVAGVAIGFAAQTSFSNLISGLFVLTEGAIKVGDFISVNDVMGTVDIIGLLSVRIHTPDNQMVRIPNSSIIDSNLINYSYHEKRRFAFSVTIDYNTDMEKAMDVLKKAPGLCPTVLNDPAPFFWFDGFGDSGINAVAAVWFNKADLFQTKTDMYIAIKKVFDEAEIEIPYNRIVLRNDG